MRRLAHKTTAGRPRHPAAILLRRADGSGRQRKGGCAPAASDRIFFFRSCRQGRDASRCAAIRWQTARQTRSGPPNLILFFSPPTLTRGGPRSPCISVLGHANPSGIRAGDMSVDNGEAALGAFLPTAMALQAARFFFGVPRLGDPILTAASWRMRQGTRQIPHAPLRAAASQHAARAELTWAPGPQAFRA